MNLAETFETLSNHAINALTEEQVRFKTTHDSWLQLATVVTAGDENTNYVIMDSAKDFLQSQLPVLCKQHEVESLILRISLYKPSIQDEALLLLVSHAGESRVLEVELNRSQEGVLSVGAVKTLSNEGHPQRLLVPLVNKLTLQKS